MMKKVITFFTILGVLLPVAGCINENSDNCPVEDPFNIALEFLLPDGKEGCKFMSNVSAVNLHIYDVNQKLVEARLITPEQLEKYKGVKLTLPAGMYNVVGWGNINDDYIFHDEDDTENPYSSGVVYDPLDNKFGGGCGKIYYAPRSGAFTRSGEMPGCHIMNVDPETGYQGTLEFRPAYRIIKVYVEGYNGTPEIWMTGLPTRLSWLGMERIEDGSGIIVVDMKATKPYEQEGIVYDYAEFETFHFDGSNSIVLEVSDPETWDVNYSVLLNDIVEEINDPNEIEISILIQFTPVGVEVSVPEWHRQDVDPAV